MPGFVFGAPRTGGGGFDAVNDGLMEAYQRLPVAFASGSGAWLTDVNGEQYLDALSGIAVCGLGHAHPAVAQALCDQAGKLVHTSNLYRIPLQEQLAAELCGLAGMRRAFFCNSGAEANETALKICRKYAHEQGLHEPVIVAMEGGFHGRTLATLAATGNPKVKKGFAPLPPGFVHVPYNDIPALQELARSDRPVAGVILEAVQGESGVVVPDAGYLKAVRRLCDDNGWLLMVDEVQTGLCRTGAWFACLLEHVTPDLMTLAKSLGNGVPIGACLASGEAAGVLTPGSHGSTFGGNPLAARAALAVIDTMRTLRLDQRAATLGRRMLEALQGEIGGLETVTSIRGRGLMIGIEFDRDCTDLVRLALERRLLINVTAGHTVRLLPPLIISDAEADRIVELLAGVIGGKFGAPR